MKVKMLLIWQRKLKKNDKKENEKENENDNNNNNDMNITKIKKEEFMKKSKCNICINKKMKLIIFLIIPLILTSIILLIMLTRGGNNTIENKDIKKKMKN